MSKETQSSWIVPIACRLLAQAIGTGLLFAFAFVFSPLRDGKYHWQEPLMFATGLSAAVHISNVLKKRGRSSRRPQI